MRESPLTQTAPSLLDTLAARFRPQGGWRNRLAHWALLVLISVSAGFVISPGLYSQQIPTLGEEQLGRPFQASSAAGFKAGRDYDIVYHALTEQRRDEARRAVQPVYDLNPALVKELGDSVSNAFVALRAAMSAAPSAEARPLSEAALREDFFQRLLGRREADALDTEDFSVLRAAQLSPELEAATLMLIERAYQNSEGRPVYVAGSREELSRVGEQGLVVRDVQQGKEETLEITARQLMDVRETYNELERFASVPGNLLPEARPILRRAVLRLAKRLVRPNLTINIAETDARRRSAEGAVKDAVISIKKGQRVIGDGELVNDSHLVVLKGMRAQTDRLDLAQLQVGGTGLVALLITATYLFCRAAFRRFKPTRKDAFLLGLLLMAMLGFIELWVTISDAVQDRYGRIPIEAFYYALPVAGGAMLVRFLLNEELALAFAIVLACLAGLMLGNSLAFGIYTLVGSLVAADRVARAKDRVAIFKAGAVTGGVNVLTVLCLALGEGKGLSVDTFLMAGFALTGTALMVPVMVMALTPLIETTFGYASDIKLLELANLNHPALKELIVQAPGTYHHSIIIGTLVENAAEAVGANPLLARSCAYYHDIGKGRSPLYFGENQKGENRHDSLAPAMSAVIIKRHVTEGLEMARQYRLPKLVADAIPQHHGTRLVGYFFHKALKEQEGKENPLPVDESIYRYAGPKPQFREAALVMIADAVESSSRSIVDPTQQKLQAQVQKIINLIFAEGQLDECELTLKDLHLISQSFLRTLEGIYHARPAYPPGALQQPPLAAVAPAAAPPEGQARSAGS